MTDFANQDFNRIKEGFRFQFNGMKLNAVPDLLGPTKYAYALNVRGYKDGEIITRPGLVPYVHLFTHAIITDMDTLASLQTDDRARLYMHLTDDSIYLDNVVKIGQLSGNGASQGASMIPFRPNQSPNPYMYIANGFDYRKFSAPSATGVVDAQKVGIAEPQVAPNATLSSFQYQILGGSYTAGGTAGGVAAGTRSTDTVQAPPLADPVNNSLWSVPVSSSIAYQKQMPIGIAATGFLVLDVFPPLPTSIQMTAIQYFTGSNGRCIVYPNNIGPNQSDSDASIYTANLLTALRRGAIIRIGSENCIVWSVIQGPDGTIAIETSTTSTHTTADAITVIAAIQVLGGAPTNGQTIAAGDITATVTVGIGTLTSTMGGLNPFVNAGFSYQPEDFITFGLLVDNLLNLNEIKIMFDVSDGTFTKDFYYKAIRPSDLAQAIANTSTQISAYQVLAQRELIDEQQAASVGNQQRASTSAILGGGTSVWSQIVFNISDMIRVGTDSNKSLQNVNHIQVLVNANATVNIGIDEGAIFGGNQPDVGPTGNPYLYRVRPRSTVTGAVGNPSPATRYGVNARRATVQVILPSASYDPQIDTWDVFRYGGSVTEWRYVGSATASAPFFFDNFTDDAVGAGQALDFDNFEPWPSIDMPFIGTATTVVGPIATFSSPVQGNLLNYLPGTLVRLGGTNVYTLRQRPVQLQAGVYRFEFIENASFQPGAAILIEEPLVANQKQAYMWGPDAAGTVFGVGDYLRTGTVSMTKTNAPDSVPDKYNLEIVQPSEPLLGGEIIDGLCYVASSERWWGLYPQFNNPLQRYNPVQQPMTRGLAAPFGHCNDGKNIYWWAKDGIYSSNTGSLTDADLYQLFPHDGIQGTSITINGNTVQAPDYSKANTFRLVFSNNYLYAIYQDKNGIYRMLVCYLPRVAWSVDSYYVPISAALHVEQKPSQNGVLNPVFLMAGNGLGFDAFVYQVAEGSNDNSTPISCALQTFEFDGGDVRAGEQWGDVYMDTYSAEGITIYPTFLGVPSAPGVVILAGTSRTQGPISIGGALTTNFLGLYITWQNGYFHQSFATKLYIWQPSFLIKPPLIVDQISDWNDAEMEGAKFFQGFILHADTNNAAKGLDIRDADTLQLHPYSPVVQHNGESELAYSFITPFIAHMVRIESADLVPWRLFDVRWVAEPTPEQAETWQTQGTAFGLTGWMHVKQVSPAWASTAPITLTITAYGGLNPAPITLPATLGGLMEKHTFQLTANKGKLYFFKATSSVPFQLFLPDWEIKVGQWGRSENYLVYKSLGGEKGDKAKI